LTICVNQYRSVHIMRLKCVFDSMSIAGIPDLLNAIIIKTFDKRLWLQVRTLLPKYLTELILRGQPHSELTNNTPLKESKCNDSESTEAVTVNEPSVACTFVSSIARARMIDNFIPLSLVRLVGLRDAVIFQR
jgi:hypothetical protein